MTYQKLALVGALSIAMLGLGACSSKASRNDVSATSQAAAKAGASEYTSVTFAENSTTLTDSQKRKLNSLAEEARRNGKVAEIKILAWADREYPAEGQKATRSDIDLAERRAEAVRKYLKDELKTKADIEEHNMAERPGTVSSFLGTSDYDTKTAFEGTGAAPAQGQSVIGNKASTALIMVEYEN